jgi:hypothetical protein
VSEKGMKKGTGRIYHIRVEYQVVVFNYNYIRASRYLKLFISPYYASGKKGKKGGKEENERKESGKSGR